MGVCSEEQEVRNGNAQKRECRWATRHLMKSFLWWPPLAGAFAASPESMLQREQAVKLCRVCYGCACTLQEERLAPKARGMDSTRTCSELPACTR